MKVKMFILIFLVGILFVLAFIPSPTKAATTSIRPGYWDNYYGIPACITNFWPPSCYGIIFES